MDNAISTHESSELWGNLLTIPALWAGWQKVRLNQGGAGGDGVRVDQFERGAVQRVERLAADLAGGRYRPGPFRTVAIPKKKGGERVLAIPCVADRVVQSAAAQLLSPVLEPTFEKASFAYRPGRGVAQAVQAVMRYRRQGYRWTAEGDVERCFDEIPHDQLLEVLEERTGDPRFTDLVALWLDAFSANGVGIPQGSPISPLLCNLHLDAVDEAIDGSGVRLVRYADDFVILAKSEAGARASLEAISAQLRLQGLDLNPDKSRIVQADQALRFLGHVFVRGMAWKEIESEDDGDPPPPPDAPPEELLARWTQDLQEEAAAVPEQKEPRASRLRTLYLVEPGSLLSIRNDSFVALAPEEPDAEGDMRRQGRILEHARRIDRIEIGPGAEAEWKAQKLAAAYGIPIAMVDGFGATLAWTCGPRDIRASRIAAQAGFLADDERRFVLTMAFVLGRVRNQRIMLRRLNRTRKLADISAAAVVLKRIALGLPDSASPHVANGHEGRAASHYWPAFARAVAEGFEFDHQEWRRRRRPPPDPVNACIGYLAALLERDIRVAVERAGLHPGLGALHAAHDRGDALVFDLMEAFRAPIVETLVATLMGRRALKPGMFVIRDERNIAGDPEPRCRMERDARRALIQGYESWLSRPIKSRRSGKFVMWRALFEEEARALADLFDGTSQAFLPYEMDF